MTYLLEPLCYVTILALQHATVSSSAAELVRPQRRLPGLGVQSPDNKAQVQGTSPSVEPLPCCRHADAETPPSMRRATPEAPSVLRPNTERLAKLVQCSLDPSRAAAPSALCCARRCFKEE